MAQLNDLLVMGQSTLLGPTKIDSIIDKNGSNGATNSSTIDKVLKSDDNGKLYWGSADNVSISRVLTAGTKIATITINGTNTDLYCQTNTNTTYTFSGGTNKFTVTPSGGSAQEVTITPSIANNITGTGTNGYLAKFNGQNTITSGPQLGNSTTTYLRNDGAWATPPNDNTWRTIQCSGTSIGNNTLNLIAGSNISLAASGGTITITASNTTNTCGASNSTSTLYLVGRTAQNTGVSYSNSNVYMTDGELTAASFNASSDSRLKENLISFNPQKSILDLPVYKYDFINGSKNQIGCMAQDLQEICPEIVKENDNGYLSIQESKIVYLLIDEVKKLKEEINYLKQGG